MSKKVLSRIRRYNNLNWVIEDYIPPEIIKVGKYKGQMSNPKWEVSGYYGRLEDIPNALMKKCLSCNDVTVENLFKAVEDAKQECLVIINEFIKESKNDQQG